MLEFVDRVAIIGKWAECQGLSAWIKWAAKMALIRHSSADDIEWTLRHLGYNPSVENLTEIGRDLDAGIEHLDEIVRRTLE